MRDRIVEGIIASTIAAILLAVLAKVAGFVSYDLDIVVLFLALAVVASLWTSLLIRRRLRGLQEELATIPYERYFADESSAYAHIPSLLHNASRLRLVSLANTNVVHLFDHYKSLLQRKCPIEVLCLDPDASGIVDSLDKLVAIAASKSVIPKLLEVIANLPIPDATKEEARLLARNDTPGSAVKMMIQISLCIWRALAQEAENAGIDSSRFIIVRLYCSPPTIKGWIIGEDRVLRGDFSIPGYGLTEPLMLFGGHRAATEVNNFKHIFQLLSTDRDTRTFLGGGDVRTDRLGAPAVGLFSSLAGSFYEKSGRKAIREALHCIEHGNGAVAVDLGSGTGHLSLELARKLGVLGRVISVDIDGTLIASLQKQLKNVGLRTGDVASIEVVQSDASQMTLPTASVNYVWCRHSIHHFADPGEVLSRIWEWLREDGSLIITEVAAPDDVQLRSFLKRVAFLANPTHVRYYSLGELRSLLAPFKFEIGEPFLARDY